MNDSNAIKLPLTRALEALVDDLERKCPSPPYSPVSEGEAHGLRYCRKKLLELLADASQQSVSDVPGERSREGMDWLSDERVRVIRRIWDEGRQPYEGFPTPAQADTIVLLCDELLRARHAPKQASGDVQELAMALEREKLWKDECAKAQEEVRALKARLVGAHVTKPGQVDIYGEDYSERQLIEFLREAARNAKEGKWGMWRAKEFDAAAAAMERMYESYLAVCDHEAENERLIVRGMDCLAKDCAWKPK
jgi:hypothetical protein